MSGKQSLNNVKSDTPRTDEQINGKPCTRFAILAGDSLRDAFVPSEFARQLERENAALRADKERLDLLDSQVWPDGKRTDPTPPIIQLVVKRFFHPYDEWVNCAQNARKTIDAARAALEGGGK